jgi:hypothetical protein
MNLDHTVFDFFSFWIFLWFILFYIGIIRYNPLFFLISSAIIIYIFFLFLIFDKNINNYNLTKYLIINSLFKLIPIYLIFDLSILFSFYDIFFGIILFIIYLFYMKILNKDLYSTYDKIYKSYLNDENYLHDRDEISKFYDNLLKFFN